jgi:hypothetical protein
MLLLLKYKQRLCNVHHLFKLSKLADISTAVNPSAAESIFYGNDVRGKTFVGAEYPSW